MGRLEGLEGLPGLGQPASVPDLPLPDGAEFLDQRYSCAAGARRYRLYVPSTAGEGLQGLIVMLHGCTQNPEDFAAGTGMNALAEEHRLLVVYPAQTGGDNSMSCWNWFRPGDQMRDGGEPAIIAGLTDEPPRPVRHPEGPRLRRRPVRRRRDGGDHGGDLSGALRGDRRPLGPGLRRRERRHVGLRRDARASGDRAGALENGGAADAGRG